MSCHLINSSVVIIALLNSEIDCLGFSIPCHRHRRILGFIIYQALHPVENFPLARQARDITLFNSGYSSKRQDKKTR